MSLTHLSCLFPYRTPKGDLVGCGRCLACRVKKRREWTIRNQLELQSWNQKGLFVTLTYSEENLPLNIYGKPTLRPADLTKFFKRLRKELSKQNRKIRYFACGEYGTKTARSHYHAIIYGVDENDSELIHKCWGLDGFDTWIFKRDFGWIEPDSIQYVCGYVTKKWTSKSDKKKYELEDRVPPFSVVPKGLVSKSLLKERTLFLKAVAFLLKVGSLVFRSISSRNSRN